MIFPERLVRLSALISERTGGTVGMSLCGRWWEARLRGSRVAKVIVYLTDRLFFFDKDHCRTAWIAGVAGRHKYGLVDTRGYTSRRAQQASELLEMREKENRVDNKQR